MAAIRTVTRVADCDDVVGNAGKIPDALIPVPSDAVVLSLLGGGQVGDPNANRNQGVNHGFFWWPVDSTLGTKFVWDAWLMPTVQGYFISDGYGGDHALLWGFGAVPGTTTGNIYVNDPTGTTKSFTGTYVVNTNEWVHLRLAWDGSYLYHFVNGICDSSRQFTGTRVALPSGFGGGHLFVGGSDHLNFGGSIAAMWAWDRGQSLPGTNFATGEANAFIPARFGMREWTDGQPADFFAVYNGGPVVRDLAPIGCLSDSGTVARRHDGVIWNYGGSVLNNVYNPVGVLPAFISDPACPFGRPLGSTLPAENIPAPGSVPGGAKVFDSFGRRNQTFAFQDNPTLGSTEGGSLGPLAWSQGMTQYTPARSGKLWGILGGAAVFLDIGPAAAWVESGTGDVDIRVRRTPGDGNLNNTGGLPGVAGIAFRLVDKDNWWFFHVRNYNGTLYMRTGHWVAASSTYTNDNVNIGAANASWTHIRVVTSGTTITYYTGDGNATWTQQAQDTAQTLFQTATKHGICSAPDGSQTTSSARYKDFVIF